MIIPAAGSGSRLGLPPPKLLAPVAGRAMIDHVLDRYTGFVDRFVIVVNPSFAEAVRRHLSDRKVPIELALQPSPTGMLDAILIPAEALEASRTPVWVTWCDQVAVRRRTVERLASACEAHPDAALVLPTALRDDPYIHFDRDAAGEICAVLQRREGDAMPARGENDLGLFALSAHGYFELLPRFARDATGGAVTGERAFLLFAPWLRGHASVVSVPGAEPSETVGVNTPADLAAVEARLDRP